MIDPQAQALIDLIAARAMPAIQTLSPAEARTFYRDRRFLTQPAPPAIAEVRPLEASGPHGAIPLRLYRPESNAAALPLLVYFHGGGWTIGDLDTHDVLCREFAIGAGCAVLSVDYRMGPEHRFPAAVDDCMAATRWAREHAALLRIDPARVAVGGDSAGGNLAAVVAIAARDGGAERDAVPLVFQLLIYPATDMRRGHASHTANGIGYLLERDTIAYYHDHYIGDPTHDLDWRASPLLADDLSGLPPALVLTAGYDPLRDEGADYADRLSAAGTRCTYACFERQIHGFITMGRVIAEANSAVSFCAAELSRAFSARVA